MVEKTYESTDWRELGIVVDEDTGMAALVGVSLGGGKPLPSVQIGRVIGPERRFSPFLHPAVDWIGGKGAIRDPRQLGIPSTALQDKIVSLLSPFLVERPGKGLDELFGQEVVDLQRPSGGEARLGCLSCS